MNKSDGKKELIKTNLQDKQKRFKDVLVAEYNRLYDALCETYETCSKNHSKIWCKLIEDINAVNIKHSKPDVANLRELCRLVFNNKPTNQPRNNTEGLWLVKNKKQKDKAVEEIYVETLRKVCSICAP